MAEILYGNIRKGYIMTEKQIKKLEEKKEKIDNKICNLRALRQESKDKDDKAITSYPPV